MRTCTTSFVLPARCSRGITHTWMGETWMDDGEALVMMMAMISSNSPPRQGAGMEFLNPELGFAMAVELRNSFWKTIEPPSVFGSRGLSSRKGSPEGWPRWPHPIQARPRGTRVWTRCGPLVAPLRLVFWLRGSSGKIWTLPLFPGIFL